MIRISIILLVVLVVCPQFTLGQTLPGQEIDEPVLDGRAVYIQEDGTHAFLEQQRAEEHGGHSNLEGYASPFRLDRDRLHEFIVHVDYRDDAKRYLRVFRLKHKFHHTAAKSHRYIHMPHHQLERIESLPFDYKRYGESSLQITLKNKLIPGEYAITYGLDLNEVFNLFGVD